MAIGGTRIPVHQIVKMPANGDTIEELLEEYPSIVREDIYAAKLLIKQAKQHMLFDHDFSFNLSPLYQLLSYGHGYISHIFGA